jgi:hypothetical protein
MCIDSSFTGMCPWLRLQPPYSNTTATLVMVDLDAHKETSEKPTRAAAFIIHKRALQPRSGRFSEPKSKSQLSHVADDPRFEGTKPG